MAKSVFEFKKFSIIQSDKLHKVGTDAMVLGSLVNGYNPKSILDVGTGCGVIALMMAQKFPVADIVGIDIDKNAVSLAQENFQNALFKNSFSSKYIDFLDFYPKNKFDLIVSNPPYFNSNMPSSLRQRNQARHEGRMTVAALIHHAKELLNEEGALWIIVPKERAEELVALEKQFNFRYFYRIRIFGKPNRHVRDVLIFTSKYRTVNTSQPLIIRNDDGDYTQQYRNLTQSFHHKGL